MRWERSISNGDSAMQLNNDILINKHGENTDVPIYIIAEVGINHNGDINLAKQSIDAAANAGADAVKFQSYHTVKSW